VKNNSTGGIYTLLKPDLISGLILIKIPGCPYVLKPFLTGQLDLKNG
jgi:hypothetical protein